MISKPYPSISNVSIHAPGRGATQRACKVVFVPAGVSIHAPGRGATIYYLIYFATKVSFNSRTREGCDCKALALKLWLPRFNSRTREGCDLFGVNKPNTNLRFQFTHPGGVRLDALQQLEV